MDPDARDRDVRAQGGLSARFHRETSHRNSTVPRAFAAAIS
ncbi:hypothetical protein A33M_4311 [Rhodovulum sp. PH10]|nr:hypothetical protein A33M_4311 [Rhodovulum sp. PH10]